MKPTRALLALAVAGLLTASASPIARAQEADAETPLRHSWSFAGPFGKFDRAQLQRGFKIYKEVCSSCHSLELLTFGNLAEPGGPGFSDAQAAGLAATYKIQDGPNEQGEMFERPGRPADHFPKPFANENAARSANGGAAPPDMSVLAEARGYKRGFPWFIFDIFTQYQELGPDYISSLLTGYGDPPKGVDVPKGAYYNKYFPGDAIKMPPPLTAGQMAYDDDAPTTLQAEAQDVAAFLMWAAEPKLEARKRTGFQVMIFLIVLAGLFYFTKKKVWKEVELHPEELTPRAPTEYPRA